MMKQRSYNMRGSILISIFISATILGSSFSVNALEKIEISPTVEEEKNISLMVEIVARIQGASTVTVENKRSEGCDKPSNDICTAAPAKGENGNALKAQGF